MSNKRLNFDRTEAFKGAFDKYKERLPKIREVARLHGYAIAVHGSQNRDFDIIACPWVEDASSPEFLIRDIVVICEGFLQKENNPAKKPHGRLAYIIMIGGHLYIDCSVMPLNPTPQSKEL